MLLGKNKDAVEAYKKAYSIKSDYDNAHIGAAHATSAIGDSTGAIEALNQALKINSSRAQTYQELGSAYASQKKYLEAESNFQKALSCKDSSAEKNAITYYNLSTVMIEQDKKSQALNYAKLAYDNRTKTEPSVKASIIYNYALLKQEAGETIESMTLYQEVLQIDSNHVKANTNLGALVLEQGDYTTAILLLERAYTKDPQNFEVNNNLGNAYRSSKDYENSVKYYKNALAISSDDNTVRENLAKSYTAAKDFANAKELYEQLVKIQPGNADMMYDLAKVCISKGDIEDAEKYLLYLQAKQPSYKTQEVSSLLDSLR